MRRVALLALLLPGTAPAAADDPEQSPLVRALKDELARAPQLKMPGTPPPYFLGYEVFDEEVVRVSAAFGALEASTARRERVLRVDVRVGDPTFDNTNFIDRSFGGFGAPEWLPLRDDYDALRHEIWVATDREYKRAVEGLEKKRATEMQQTASPEHVGDFSPAPAARSVSMHAPPPAAARRLEALTRKISAVFREAPEIHAGRAIVTATHLRRWYVSTEGTFAYEPRTTVRVAITCETQAEDGMRLERFHVASAPSTDELPAEAALLAEAGRMVAELSAARKTPVAAAYVGPVLFEGVAAAQLLRAILVPHLSGTPAPGSADPRLAQMMGAADTELAERIGQRILPAGFRVEDDPTIDRVAGRPLVGGYGFDDEGIPAEKVILVEDGFLRRFLMSRAPRKGFDRTNGHGRGGPAMSPRGAAANVIVSTDKGMSDKELRRRLLAAARADGLQYAIVIRALEEPGLRGDFARRFFGDAGRKSLAAVVVAYRVGLDGREEPLRGLELARLPLRQLKNLLAAGKDTTVLSYRTGDSPSGRSIGPPTSIATPGLLLGDVELTKVGGPRTRPPSMPRPR